MMSSQHLQTPLATFFKTYNFQEYKYNPSNPPTEEFTRLCVARKWGPEKVVEKRALFDNALRSASFGNAQEQLPATQKTNAQLKNFFKKYEFSGFSYNPAASAESEFQRMCKARKWGKKNLEKVTREFKEALNSSTLTGSAQKAQLVYWKPVPKSPSNRQHDTPISAFLIRQNCPGYTYSRRSPETEFQDLTSIKEQEWERQNPKRDPEKKYRESREFLKLRKGFNAAVEKEFDLLLKVGRGSVQEKGLRPWEILVELFGVGKAPMNKEDAEIALDEVYVNIFDFIEARVTSPGAQGIQEMFDSSSEKAKSLEFPDAMLLGVYSVLTKRVYPLKDAKDSGTLVLLLHRIRKYFGPFEDILKAFKDEAGDSLTRARSEGPSGIRKLLLSRQWRSLGRL